MLSWRAVLERWRANRADASAARANRADGRRCFYCGVTFADDAGRQRTVDHRVARGRGGHDGLVNLVFACHACNQRKADRSEDDFVGSAWLADRRARVSADPGAHFRR